MLTPMPSLIGHRGLPIVAPENTQASITAAAQNGIEWIEVDVTMAGDGSLVIMHDLTLKRFGHSEAALADIGFADLKKVDAGSWFHPNFKGEPLLFLNELITLVQTLQLKLNLEIKINPNIETERQVNAVYNTLKQTDFPNDQLIISSFDHEALSILRHLSESIRIAVLVENIPENLLVAIEALKPVSIHCDQGQLTQQQAEEISAHYPIYCYTVNDTTTLTKLLGWGVSGVFCDRAHSSDMRETANKATSL